MTLWYYALEYDTYPKAELRGFVLQRLRLSGREYSRCAKPALIRRLQELDDTDTFRFMDLPLELREHIYEYALMQKSSLIPLLRVSRQVRQEVEPFHWKKTRIFLAFYARMDIYYHPFQWSLDAVYHGHSQCLDRASIPIIYSLHSWSDMFCNIRYLELCVALCPFTDDDRQREISNVAGNHTLFHVCAFYAYRFRNDHCHLETLEVWPHLQDTTDMNEIGVEEIVNIIWPLKLLEGKANIKISAFSQEVIDAYSKEAIGADEAMADACELFEKSFYGKGGEGRGLITTRSKMCAHCTENAKVADSTQRLLKGFPDYIGPNSESALKVLSARIAEASDVESGVCTCFSEPERPPSPLSLPLWDEKSWMS